MLIRSFAITAAARLGRSLLSSDLSIEGSFNVGWSSLALTSSGYSFLTGLSIDCLLAKTILAPVITLSHSLITLITLPSFHSIRLRLPSSCTDTMSPSFISNGSLF